jgi:predicted nucleotidyltransferase
VELRAWLDHQLAELAAEHTTDGKAHALAYAEAAAQLYNTAYYELARQVHIPA